MTPLTSQSCRNTMIREGNYGALATKLDSMLTIGQADALESYADCWRLLRGAPKISDSAGDRVQSAHGDYAPLADSVMARLKRFAVLRAAVPPATRAVLDAFAAQQSGESRLSDSQCGLRINPRAANAAQEWRHCVVAAAETLLATTLAGKLNSRQRATSRR